MMCSDKWPPGQLDVRAEYDGERPRSQHQAKAQCPGFERYPASPLPLEVISEFSIRVTEAKLTQGRCADIGELRDVAALASGLARGAVTRLLVLGAGALVGAAAMVGAVMVARSRAMGRT